MTLRSTPRPVRARAAVLLAVAALAAGACGDDTSDDDAGGGLSSLVATTTTTEAPAATTTTAAPTTTTEAPRPLTPDDLRSVLLQPEDVPLHFVAGEEIEGNQPFVTDPPDCGSALGGGEASAISFGTTYFDPDGYHAYESYVDHTPGLEHDLEELRRALAGACTEPFTVEVDGVAVQQRFELLADPDLGDDALAARLDVDFVQEGHAVDAEAFMVYVRRGDVLVQVQAVTGDAPSAGIAAVELDLDDVVRVARRIDERLVALRAVGPA